MTRGTSRVGRGPAAGDPEALDRERSVPAEPGREGEFANVIPRAQRDRNVRDGFHPLGFRPGVLGSG